jgi:hypothetical protein
LNLKRKISLAICAFTLAFGILGHDAFAQNTESFPFGFPTSRENGNQVLSLGEVRRMASYQAGLTWGRAYRILEIPCVDLNGSLIAYQVIFRLVDKDAGIAGGHAEASLREESYEEIQQKVRYGREQYRAASKRLREAERRMAKRTRQEERKIDRSNESVTQNNPQRSQRQPRGLSEPEEFKNAREEKEKARRLMTGAGRYGTVLVTVQEGLVPIPVISHGLPPFYTKADLMQDLAKTMIHGTPKINRIYMAGPLDQWFEFKTEQGEKVLIDPFRMRAIDLEKETAGLPRKSHMEMAGEDAVKKRKSLLQEAHREISE